MIEDLPQLVNGDARLVERGRFLSTTFLVEVGGTPYLVEVDRGSVRSVVRGPFVMPRWSFAVRAPQEAWEAFWAPVPRPGFQDLLAMKKSRILTLEGDVYPFMANLLYFKALLAAPRRRAAA